MVKLSTHVLDTANGRPAAGMGLELYRLDADGQRTLVLRTRTNADGRCERPLLEGSDLARGRYCLRFAVGAYFAGNPATGETREALASADADRAGPLPFLDQVPIEFAIEDPQQSYHVPLLVSPWSYTTYRGS